MRTTIILILLGLATACGTPGGGAGGGDAGDVSSANEEGKRAFSSQERALMDTAWRAFKQRSPDWPRLREQWVGLGEKPTNALVETLFQAMVVSWTRSAPDWFDRSKRELMLLREKAVPTLAGVLQDPMWTDPSTGDSEALPTELQNHVVDVLVVAGRRAIPTLSNLTASGRPMVRRKAAMGLGQIKDPAGVPPLTRMLSGGRDWIDRATAAKALGLIPGRASEDALIRALDDRDADVVLDAARSLVRLRCTRAVSSLNARRARAESAGDVRTAMACEQAAKALRGGAVTDWRIARKGRDCAVCGKSFPAGEDFVSAIFEVPDGEEGLFERIDACPPCFDQVGRDPYSRWTTRQPPEQGSGPLLDLPMAKDFLVRLARENDPERGHLMHLLALLLLRKRKVKLAGRRNEEEGPFLDLLVKTEDGEVEIAVPATPPTEEEAASLQAELGRLFGFD